jgi:hypothetical protein
MDVTELTGMHFLKMVSKKNFSAIILILFVAFDFFVSAATVPTPQGDIDNWGDILNSFLQVEHNASGSHNANMSVNGLAIKSGRWLDVTAYGAVGDGIRDDTAAIQSAINNAAINGGVVFFPVGNYLVSSPLIIYSGVMLQGIGEGTKIIAANNFNGSVIKSSPDYLLNNTEIKDLEINASNQVSGSGIWIRIGELTTIDRVKIYGACNDGIVIYGNSSPVILGYISLNNNGRCGSGAGVYINNSQYTNNYIEYLFGVDNHDALVKVKDFNQSSLFLIGFDAEKNNASKQNYIIWLDNGEGGEIMIGSGRINQSGGRQGNAILYNTIGGGSIGRFDVLGGIFYDINYTNYTWYYASDNSNSSNQSFIDLNGRPFSQASHFFRTEYSPYALELEGPAKFSLIHFVYPGYEVRLTNENFENVSALGVGGTNAETVYWRYTKGVSETWMALADAPYNWYFPNDAISFAPGGGNALIIITSIFGGRVSIGKTTRPVSTLEINGTVTLNTQDAVPIIFANTSNSVACNSANNGAIKFNTTKFYSCNSTDWNALY